MRTTRLAIFVIPFLVADRTLLIAQQSVTDSSRWPDERFLSWTRGISARFGKWLLDSGPADWALVLVGVAGTWMAWRTLQAILEELKHTAKLADAAKANADASLMAQRPYVDMSHLPPGLNIDTTHVETAGKGDVGHQMSIEFEIKNHGRTPADVMSNVVALLSAASTAPLPDSPPYPSLPREGETILMAGQSLFICPDIGWLPHADYEKIQSGSLTLYVIGYVEYRDRFGKSHRSGYARHYDPFSKKNNLLYVTKTGYNYDVEIDAQGHRKG